MKIPEAPKELMDSLREEFTPSDDLAAWTLATFIGDTAKLSNPEHSHLQDALIGYLWTNVANASKGRFVIGTAETGAPQGAIGKWPRARAVQQVEDWFGAVPDFIITVFAPWWDQADNKSRCALIEHELLHCAQAIDAYGQPRFSKSTGRPIYTIKGHDLEEFTDVVGRYGAWDEDTKRIVEAANSQAELDQGDIDAACGGKTS